MTSPIEFCLETVLWSSLISFSLKLYLKVYNIRISFYSISWEQTHLTEFLGRGQCHLAVSWLFWTLRRTHQIESISSNLSCKGDFSSFIIGNVIYTIINMEHNNSKQLVNLSICFLLINSSIWMLINIDIIARKSVCLSINWLVHKVSSIVCIEIFCISEYVFFKFTQK